MLDFLHSADEPNARLLLDDPVRPTIPPIKRIGLNRQVFFYCEPNTQNDKSPNGIQAVACCCYQQTIPTTEQELFETCETPSIAVFYSIWSYQRGAGRALLLSAAKYIWSEMHGNLPITRIVTLSPKTTMAREFHLSNGAIIFRENAETINYEYRRQDVL